VLSPRSQLLHIEVHLLCAVKVVATNANPPQRASVNNPLLAVYCHRCSCWLPRYTDAAAAWLLLPEPAALRTSGSQTRPYSSATR
jgi:hypothetical protein